MLTALVLLASAATQRSAGAVPDAAQAAATAPLPTGDEGDLITYGRSLITDTQKYAGAYITAGMSCSACHIAGGTVAHGGSLLGIYAKFPQWNKRAKRFITLQDRLAECFLYSMNGRPPAYASREMIAMVAFLSRGAEVGKGFPDQGFVTVAAPAPANASAGAKIYATQCASCHGADGAGTNGAFPPLWGPKSFNDGAGMNTKMASFVKSNMPLGRGGTLTDQQAVDVSAFVLSHERPHFDAARGIAFPTLTAGFF
jgi:thiosulfate dehydrogenase